MTEFNPFSKVQLVHFYDGGHYHAIQWTIDPTFKDEAPFTFIVEVSETPDFSELIYTLTAEDSFIAVDRTNNLQTNNPSWYYRVKLTTGSGKVYYSPSIYHFAKKEEAHKYWTAREIVRREFVRFNYTGHHGYILKRKNYGEIAKGYVDPISGVPIADVAVDNSTGFVGGYHKPLKIVFSEEGGANRTAYAEDGSGVNNIEQLKVRMVGFPVVYPKDILVDEVNARYEVGSDIGYVYFPGTHILIVQTFTAKLLPFNDVAYNIKIDE